MSENVDTWLRLVTYGDLDALRSTISFLSSVIRCGEPYTPDVQQAVDNAFTRLDRMAQVKSHE